MHMSTLVKSVLIGAAQSSLDVALDVAGSAVLPGAWPILKRALEPVLERLAQRIGVTDVTKTPEIAEKAAAEFAKDGYLQELLRSNLINALEPVLAGQQKLDVDMQKLAILAIDNSRTLAEVAGGINNIEEVLSGGVKLSERDIEALAEAVSRRIENARQTRKLAIQEIGPDLHNLIKRQASRLTARAVELIREGKPGRAFDELNEGVVLVATLLGETPSDLHLRLQMGYIYKTYAQVLGAVGRDKEAESYLDRAVSLFRLIKDEIPADQKAALEVAEAANGLGNIYYQRQELDKALDSHRLATMLDPSYAYAWHDMFGVYNAMAKKGKIHIEGMREALKKVETLKKAQVEETGQGLPGLSDDYLAQLKEYLSYWEQELKG